MKSDSSRFGENLRLENKYHTVKNTGWVLMALFIIMGLSGLLGKGILGMRRVTAPGGQLIAEYNRFLRYGARSTIRFTLVNEHPRSFTADLVLPPGFLECFTIEYVNPAPTTTKFTADNEFQYSFAAAPGTGPLPVVFQVKPNKIGRMKTTARAEQGGRVIIQQFVYF